MSLVLAFDCRPMLSRPTGVGVYVASLLSSLATLDRENRYLLFSSSLRERFDRETARGFADSKIRDWRIPVRALNFLWHRLGFPPVEAIFGERIDIAHSPHPLILPARKAKRIVTIHDLFFLTHPELVEREMATDYPRLVRDHARRADGVITVSEYSKREIVERLGVDEAKVEVIYHGGLLAQAPPIAPESARDTILFVGRVEHRKNVVNLLRAFARLKHLGARLRIVGPPGAGYEESRSVCTSLGLDTAVDFAGYESGAALEAEYARARVFAFPSLCEGFGLPLLDAMRRGIPIAASNATAIPEVAGDAALHFDPLNPVEMATAIERVWSDEELRARLRSAGETRVQAYSWNESARRTLAFYRRVVAEA
ncbi:MAG: glycosyltransferase family 4 protein [Acidobacteria bacterium]|nr:glycosyltransferase family 4 protein [Acidobacteriota bacterium]